MALTPQQMQTYQRLRAEGTPAAPALDIVRYASRPPNYPWLAGLYVPGEAEGFIGPFTVSVRIVADPDASIGEDDVTGTFTDTPDEHTIENTYQYNQGGNGAGMKYYRPANYVIESVRADYARQGMSAGQIAHAYRAHVHAAMREDHMREYYGITVDVYAAGRHVGSASLWGIDVVDTIGLRGQSAAYITEQAENMISEAMAEARAGLATEAARARAEAEALEYAAAPRVSLVKQ